MVSHVIRRRLVAARRAAADGPPPDPARALRPWFWLILAIAAAVRLVGLGWGLPSDLHRFSYHPDEWQSVETALRIITTGDLDPHFFNYPTLHIYVLAAVLKLGTRFVSPDGGVAVLYLLARLVAVALGVGTLAVTGRLAARLLSPAAGLAATALLGLLPLHVVLCHYATVDVPVVFWCTLALWAAVEMVPSGTAAPPDTPSVPNGLDTPSLPRRGQGEVQSSAADAGRPPSVPGYSDGAADSEKPPSVPNLEKPPSVPDLAWRWLLVGSVAAGLAGSTKYNGILVLPCLWAGAVLVWRREAWKLVLCSTSLAVLTVLVTSPFLVIDPQAVVDARYEILVHPHHTDLFGDVGPGWLFHLRWNLPTATGTLFALLSIAGLALLPYRRCRSAWLVVLWIGLVAVSLLRTEELYLRYLTPLLPPLCIGAAAVLERARAKGLAVHLACLLCLCAPGWRAAALAAMMARPDARDIAAEWCFQNIPQGVSVGDIGADGIQWFYSVPLGPNNGGARAKQLGSQSRWRLSLDPAAWRTDPPPWLVLNLNRVAEQFRGPEAEREWARLVARYEPVASFENEARVTPWWRITGRGSRLHDWQYTLPVIAIYRRK